MALVTVCILTSAGTALAADPTPTPTPPTPTTNEPTATERALAQTLFDEGRQLMAEQKYSEACQKFVKSQQLDPSAGTFINLALCHEAENKFATAWAEFNEALSQAVKDGRADREQAARTHIDQLKPKLNRLTVNVPPNARVNGLEIRLDGLPIKEVAWGTPTPIDMGVHDLSASAPGKKTWTQSVTFNAPGADQVIETPTLEDAPGVPTVAPKKADTSTKLGQSTIGLIVGGAGIAAVLVGSVFGVRALSKRSDSDKECPNNNCTAAGVSLNDQALTSAWIANVAIGLGLVGVGVGGYLYITAPPEESPPSTTKSASLSPRGVRVVPVLGTERGGLAVVGAF